MHPDLVRGVLIALHGYSISDFLHVLLNHAYFIDDPMRTICVQDTSKIIETLISAPSTHLSAFATMHQSFKQKLATEIALLANKSSGWHFSAVHASAEQFENFSMADMARRLETEAPLVWDLIGHLLESDSSRASRRSHYKNTPTTSAASSSTETSSWSEEDEYWAQVDDDSAGPPAEAATDEPPSKRQRRAADRNTTLLQIVEYIQIFCAELIT